MKGFTLVELMIATAIFLLVLLLTGQILLESQRMLLRTAAELETGPTELAVALLESDLQSAHAVDGWPMIWSSSTLVLIDHPDGPLRWEVRESRLERVLLDERGREVSRRVVLRDVAAWRWRSLLPRLVDVEIGVRQAKAPRGPALLARSGRIRTELRRESLRVALRGAGAYAW